MTPYTAEEAASVIRELQRELTGMRLKAETDQGYIDRKRAVIGVLHEALERIAEPNGGGLCNSCGGDLSECAEDNGNGDICLGGIAREALAKANAIATTRETTP